MPTSAADVIKTAFDHTVQQLFKPFRLGQWARLAVTGLLAGELGSAGGCGVQVPWSPRWRGPQRFLQIGAPTGLFVAVGIALLVVLAIVLMIAFMYISSRMRFVLFKSVVAKDCRIGRLWTEYRSQGFSYFLFKIVFTITMTGGIALLVGIAAAVGFGLGWFQSPRDHIFSLVLAGLVFFLVLAAFSIAALTFAVFTKDFVVPQMALENLGVVEGWRRLWPMLKSESGGYAAYAGLKILLSIVSGIAVTVAVLAAALVLLLPIALVAIMVVVVGRWIGLAWNLYTISMALTAGSIVALALILGIFLISVPTVVFFPSYSIYFFAERYPPLKMALRPPVT